MEERPGNTSATAGTINQSPLQAAACLAACILWLRWIATKRQTTRGCYVELRFMAVVVSYNTTATQVK